MRPTGKSKTRLNASWSKTSSIQVQDHIAAKSCFFGGGGQAIGAYDHCPRGKKGGWWGGGSVLVVVQERKVRGNETNDFEE